MEGVKGMRQKLGTAINPRLLYRHQHSAEWYVANTGWQRRVKSGEYKDYY